MRVCTREVARIQVCVCVFVETEGGKETQRKNERERERESVRALGACDRTCLGATAFSCRVEVQASLLSASSATLTGLAESCVTGKAVRTVFTR